MCGAAHLALRLVVDEATESLRFIREDQQPRLVAMRALVGEPIAGMLDGAKNARGLVGRRLDAEDAPAWIVFAPPSLAH